MSEMQANSDTTEVTEPQNRNQMLADVLRQLKASQLRFVAKRVWTDTDAEAAEQCGINPTTISYWKRVGVPLDRAVELMREDGVIMARELLRRAMFDAIEVKIGALYDRNANIRQAAATEILDRVLGKPTQKQEFGGGLTVVVSSLGPFGD